MTRFRQDEPYNEYYGSKEYRESWERMFGSGSEEDEREEMKEEDDDEEKDNDS